jgi:hypothetical protein
LRTPTVELLFYDVRYGINGFPGVVILLRGLKRAFLATWNSLQRPSRRRTPSLFGLEKRTLLSGRAAEKSVLVSVEPLTTSVESRTEAAKANKQARFVIGLYHTYFHRVPSPAQLNYALEQLSAGVSHAALQRDFMDVVSRSPKRVSALAFVNALYATIGGRPPTPVGQAYWLGQSNSGLSRKQVFQMFQATNGVLPPPTINWADPTGIVYGTPLSSAQLNAVASVPGTFTYSPAAGSILYGFNDQTLSVTFTPTDSADYVPVSASVAINVHAAKPTITWARPHAIMYGTPLSDIQLNATATWTVNGQTVNVPGTFTYSSPEGTVLPVETNLSLTVVFRPFDAVDYSTAVATTNITVTLGPPPPTPTPPPPTPPPTPSPTPSPTPYPTPAPPPTPSDAISLLHQTGQRVTPPPPTPPPTPFNMTLPALTGMPGASFTIPKFLVTPEGMSTETLTPPPNADSLATNTLIPESSRELSLTADSTAQHYVPVSEKIRQPAPAPDSLPLRTPPPPPTH